MAEDRLAIAGEMLELAEARGAIAEAAEAHMWQTGALLELCRLDEADVHLHRYAELAELTGRFQPMVHREAMRVMRMLLEGDFEAGAATVEELLERGRAENGGGAPMPLVLLYYASHQIAILNERDDFETLLPLCERMVREVKGVPGWRCTRAWCHVEVGDGQRARSELENLSAGEFAAIPRDVNFLPAMMMASEAIAGTVDADALASRVEPLLDPVRELWVVLGVGGLTLGPVAYALGLLQLAQDRPGDAIESFELALERSTRMRARPYVARSRAGLAEALCRRGEPGDLDRAEELAELAAADARELGMTRLERELSQSSGRP
jgi:tetratricopeptide (TPR) repeat protein